MLLYIVRHAWAEERDAERYPNDAHRPLTREVENVKSFWKSAAADGRIIRGSLSEQ